MLTYTILSPDLPHPRAYCKEAAAGASGWR